MPTAHARAPPTARASHARQVAILYCLVMLIVGERFSEGQMKMAAGVMLLCWLAEAGIGTFRAPFVVTGNGFFASCNARRPIEHTEDALP